VQYGSSRLSGHGHLGQVKGEGILTEASSGGLRVEWERSPIQRSLEDEDFRQRLLDDPKGTLEQELGDRLPEGVEVRAVEETADTIYLVLPSASPLGEGGEISDEELDAVAGEGTLSQPTCGNTCFGNTCGLNCAIP
jgi:Nitrile hydratase, alpha chain